MPAEGYNQTILQKLGWPHWSLLLQNLLALNRLYVVSHKPSPLASNRLNRQWILEASITVLRWKRHDVQANLAKSVKECWIDQRSMGWTRNFPALWITDALARDPRKVWDHQELLGRGELSFPGVAETVGGLVVTAREEMFENGAKNNRKMRHGKEENILGSTDLLLGIQPCLDVETPMNLLNYVSQ